MIRRALAGAALLGLVAGPAHAQGLEIDHKAVGCIVVGKYPKMNACFEPKGSFARGRVYFRPDGTPTWYYVEMKSDQPCFAGILPKPGKKLVGQKIDYYVEGQDKALNSGRTQEYAPVVVSSERECKKDVPIAPFLNNATVAVFPAMPAGFVAGGIGTGAILGIAAAGAAVAGTAVAVSNNNNNETTTTTPGVSPTTTTAPPATTVTTTTTTTTTVPAGVNHPPNAVLKTVPDPPQGTSPLTVTFDMCASTDPDGDPLKFFFDFGDGVTSSGGPCSQSHTYTATSLRAAGGGDVRAADTSFIFSGSAVDPGTLSGTRTRTVVVSPPTPTTTLPSCGAPIAVMGNPPAGTTFFCPGTNPFPISADATGFNADNVDFGAFPIDCSTGVSLGPADSTATAGGTFSAGGAPFGPVTLSLSPPVSISTWCWNISARARQNCSKAVSAIDSHKVTYTIISCPFRAPSDRVTVSSDLDLPGGRLQVVVNAASTAYPSSGRSLHVAEARQGENRIEATVVEAGRPGTWRVEFPSSGVKPGSLRVLAGEAATVADTSAVIKLKGTAGERVVITFVRE